MAKVKLLCGFEESRNFHVSDNYASTNYYMFYCMPRYRLAIYDMEAAFFWGLPTKLGRSYRKSLKLYCRFLVMNVHVVLAHTFTRYIYDNYSHIIAPHNFNAIYPLTTRQEHHFFSFRRKKLDQFSRVFINKAKNYKIQWVFHFPVLWKLFVRDNGRRCFT